MVIITVVALLKDIVAYIDYLREFHHLNCSFDYSFLPSEYIARYLTSIFHNNPYCTLLKHTKLAKCNLAKKVIIRRNKQEIYYAKCYAGVEEFVFPVVFENKVKTFVSVSGYRSKDASAPNFSKLQKGTNASESDLEKAYCRLNTNVPSLSALYPLVQPLVHMIRLLCFLSREQNFETDADSAPLLYNQILDYLINNYTNNISIEDVTSYCHYSATLVRRTFKKYSGFSINAYIIKLKMDRAATLLKTTDMKVNQIADALGYLDTNYFILQFKKYYQISPSKFRKKNRAVSFADLR